MAIKIKTLSGYFHEYQKSIVNPEDFWGQQAEAFFWRKKYECVLDYNFETPRIDWFKGGRLNLTENIFERQMFTLKDRPAIIWEPNDPDRPHVEYTYKELHAEVCKVANALKSLGVNKGDRICFYMPMVPELAIAVLACAKNRSNSFSCFCRFFCHHFSR